MFSHTRNRDTQIWSGRCCQRLHDFVYECSGCREPEIKKTNSTLSRYANPLEETRPAPLSITTRRAWDVHTVEPANLFTTETSPAA
ncbi:hypothetical protein E4T49_02362 [Aureobasidium sp. EXF-10728]|nr:hypothetical protein E4T49_02362 [Aureobasidium sp. EXF-10728]